MGLKLWGCPRGVLRQETAFEWRGELLWGNRRWAGLRSLQTHRTVIETMLSNKIKLKQIYTIRHNSVRLSVCLLKLLENC